ncbi:WxL domain-containing protein, partial [Enterococcus innesii]
MKKTLAFLSVLGLSFAAPVLAQAADSAEYNSNGQITFEPNTDPTNPISPTDPDPENPIKP